MLASHVECAGFVVIACRLRRFIDEIDLSYERGGRVELAIEITRSTYRS